MNTASMFINTKFVALLKWNMCGESDIRLKRKRKKYCASPGHDFNALGRQETYLFTSLGVWLQGRVWLRGVLLRCGECGCRAGCGCGGVWQQGRVWLQGWWWWHLAPQDLMLRHGWRTGAIVPELEVETKVVNTEQYAQSLTWLQALTGLLERMQVQSLPLVMPLPPGHFDPCIFHPPYALAPHHMHPM